MKKKVIAIVLSLALLSSLFVFEVPVSATTPQTVSGTWTGPGAASTVYKLVNGNMFMTYTSEHNLTGDISGQMISEGWGVLHPDFTWNMRSTGTFTGSFNGASGTAEYTLSFSGTYPYYSGKIIFNGGTDDLTNLHAVVYAEGGSLGIGGTYTGKYHLDP